MSEIVFVKDRELLEATPVDNIFISQFMPLAPDMAVKAYIYGLMLLSGSGSANADMCAALGCSETDIRAAFAYWESAGLVKVLPGEPMQVQYLNVKNVLMHGAVDTRGAKRGEFVRNLQAVLGTRMITGSELSKFYDWIDVFGFEESAAVEIVRHCLDLKGAKTSVAYMDAVARTLAGKNCRTFDDVKRQLDFERASLSGAAAILRRWRLTRPVTEDELALYEKWTGEWGFDKDSIDAALSGMTSAERPSFGYLDKILAEWHESGSTASDIRREEDLICELSRSAFARAGLRSRPDLEQRQTFRDWHIVKCMSAELILYAAELSEPDVHPFACMKRLLSDWYSRGVSSVPEAKTIYETEQRGSVRKRGAKPNRALNYMQGQKYSKDDLKKMGISLGEELYDGDEQ